MWKFIGSNKNGRKDLSSAVKVAVTDPKVKAIYNVETGSIFTPDGIPAYLVTEGNVQAITRAIATVLVAASSKEAFPADTFRKLVALAGEPYASMSMRQAREISEALFEQKRRKAEGGVDGNSGPGLDENPA